MEDGQDHQDGGEIGAGSAAMPSVEPPIGPADDYVQAAVYGDTTPDDLDETGLTGVLAALEEPDPDTIPAPSEHATADAVVAASTPTAADDELAALQAALEAEEAASQAAPAETAETASDAEAEITATAVAADGAAEPEATVADASAATATVATPAAEQEAYAAPDAMTYPEQRGAVPIWPFLVYFGLWVVFAGLLVWQFMQTPAGVPLYELALYGPSILAGLVLTALGPLLAIGVWIMLWLARPGARAGLFSRALILGAVVTLAGVALWLVALGAVDMLRLGRLI